MTENNIPATENKITIIEKNLHRTNLQRLKDTLCLFFPIAAAFAGCFLAEPVWKFFFKNETDKIHSGLHNLNGVFIKEGMPLTHNGINLFAFSVVYPTKTRIYYNTTNNKSYRNNLLHSYLLFRKISSKYRYIQVTC